MSCRYNNNRKKKLANKTNQKAPDRTKGSREEEVSDFGALM